MNFNDIALTSDYRYEHIALKGDRAVNTSGSSVSVTVAHNLGYIPYYRCYVKFSTDSRYYYLTTANPNIFYGNSGQARIESFYADTNNLYCTFDNFTGGSLSANFYYRIYEEPQT